MRDDLMPIGSLWIGGPLSWLEIASIRSFLDLGHDYVLYTYGTVPNVPEGAILRDAREIWDSAEIVVHRKSGSPALHTDIFRAMMVRQTGRVWVDTDILALRPFTRDTGWYFGHEREDRLELGYAVFGLPESSRTLARLHDFLTDPAPVPPWLPERQRARLEQAAADGRPVPVGEMAWGTLGPQAVTHFAIETGEIADAQPQGMFFPVAFQDRKALIDPRRAEDVAAAIAGAGSRCVHLYSRWLRKACARAPQGLPPRESWLGRWCAERGLLDYDAPPPPAEDGFLTGLDARRARVPGGAAVSRHGRVTIVTMAKDEGPYILEWVAWHHLLGFTDILVYTNDCTDGTDELLDALAAHGLVTRLDNGPWKDKPPQSRALHWASGNPLVQASDWLLVMDFDEFVSIREGGVDDLIDAVEARGASAICCTWRFFGSNGLGAFTPEPVTARMTRAAPESYAKGYGIKTLYRNDPNLVIAIHRPYLRMRFAREEGRDYPLHWLNGSGDPVDGREMRWKLSAREVGYGLVQLNHYGVKSREEYLLRRLRGDVLDNHSKYGPEYFGFFDRNEAEDAPAGGVELRDYMAALAALPDVAAALDLVERRREEKLARLRAQPDYAARMAELVPFDYAEALRMKRRK